MILTIINMADLIIEQKDFDFILSRIGYPFVQESDLEINFEQIKDFCIMPALLEYFKWFPILVDYNARISGSINIPFPDEMTYSATNIRINTGRNGQSYTANPLINSSFIRPAQSGVGGGIYGKNLTYGLENVYHTERIAGQSSIDMYKSSKFTIDEQKRAVVGFTNVSGTMEIVWCKYSNDFNAVPFMQKKNVEDLASAYLLEYFGHLRLQSEQPDLPVSFDGTIFVERAEKLRDKVIMTWEEFPKICIIRK
jgi:hypothetical protein